jgi:WD40 repeat protein
VALSADGQLVASGSDDGTVRLWETSSGRPIATSQGHTSAVEGMALSADGRLVASGSFDGTVKLWEAKSGTCLRTLRAERRYERMDISGLIGISAAQRASLIALGAVERPLDRAPALASAPPSDGD